mmetsp:Transcript_7396/g.13349  ORF Transcript_7396/g.13349 Transcript_7396/m.13349 type:complete len:339 (-) Transcript_7396:1483-2499(-)
MWNFSVFVFEFQQKLSEFFISCTFSKFNLVASNEILLIQLILTPFLIVFAFCILNLKKLYEVFPKSDANENQKVGFADSMQKIRLHSELNHNENNRLLSSKHIAELLEEYKLNSVLRNASLRLHVLYSSVEKCSKEHFLHELAKIQSFPVSEVFLSLLAHQNDAKSDQLLEETGCHRIITLELDSIRAYFGSIIARLMEKEMRLQIGNLQSLHISVSPSCVPFCYESGETYRWNSSALGEILECQNRVDSDSLRENFCLGMSLIITATADDLDVEDSNLCRFLGVVKSLSDFNQALLCKTKPAYNELTQYFIAIPGSTTLLLRVRSENLFLSQIGFSI